MGLMGKGKPMRCLREIQLSQDISEKGPTQRTEGMEVGQGGRNLGTEKGQEIMQRIKAAR